MKLRVGAFFLLVALGVAQTQHSSQGIPSFNGISAAEVSRPQYAVDPYGAVGTKQFMQYVNTYYQAYSKTAPYTPVWSTPQQFNTPFANVGLSNCFDITGDGVIEFDHLASRWVLAAHTSALNSYYYCVAISNTDDLSSPTLNWFTYAFALDPALGKNSQGNYWFPDWPKLGVWGDAYYVALDLNDRNNGFQEVGILVCALDRTNMLAGLTPRPLQCFENPNPVTGALYLAHSPIPAEIDGTTAPPTGRDEYLVSIENPPNDGSTTTSNTFNLWAFHVDWNNPANSTFTHSTVPVSQYEPACYNVFQITNTVCVPEPSTSTTNQFIDSVGDRFMPRLSYRNFGSYESFLVSHTIQVGTGSSQQTGIRWYELRGSGTPTLFQEGTISFDQSTFRFVPSMAQDRNADAAVGYSVSGTTLHPGIKFATWNLRAHGQTVESGIIRGSGDDESNWKWGSYTSMTVDPVDDCTFWYTNEYFPQNQTGSSFDWFTRIAHFKFSTCK
jgi:hypothetical protein